jgi:hypothetical protein
VALVIAGCGGTEQASAPAESADSNAEVAPAELVEPEADDEGMMVVSYEDATTPEATNGRQIFEDAQLLEDLAASATDLLKLPYDIPLLGTQCDEANAFWSPGDQAMSMCYEYPDSAQEIFTQAGDVDPTDSALNTQVATFYHEMGHMVIDIYDLPITCREEDVADQLSAYMLLAPGEDGRPDPDSVQAVKDAAREFSANAEIYGVDESLFADVHSLDQTRAYNMLCWVYGADPDGNADLVSSGQLPQDRADGCEDEWDKLVYAWDSLLDPHFK